LRRLRSRWSSAGWQLSPSSCGWRWCRSEQRLRSDQPLWRTSCSATSATRRGARCTALLSAPREWSRFQATLPANRSPALSQHDERRDTGRCHVRGSGAATIVLALVVLLAGGRHLGRIDAEESDVLQVGSVINSVQAITEAGQLVVVSASGSQIGAISAGAETLILVVGSQKIVPNLDGAIQRIQAVRGRSATRNVGHSHGGDADSDPGAGVHLPAGRAWSWSGTRSEFEQAPA
jgi:hypothetical protein